MNQYFFKFCKTFSKFKLKYIIYNCEILIVNIFYYYFRGLNHSSREILIFNRSYSQDIISGFVEDMIP